MSSVKNFGEEEEAKHAEPSPATEVASKRVTDDSDRELQEQSEAASKIQAIKRGNDDRIKVQAMQEVANADQSGTEPAPFTPPTLAPPTLNPMKYMSPLDNKISGTGEIGASVQLYQNNVKIENSSSTTTIVSEEGHWSMIVPLDSLQSTENTQNTFTLTTTQTKSYTPPPTEDGTVGKSVEQLSEHSNSIEIIIVNAPILQSPQNNDYVVETAEFTASGTGVPGMNVLLLMSSFGTFSPVDNVSTIVSDDGSFKLSMPPGNDNSLECGSAVIRVVHEWPSGAVDSVAGIFQLQSEQSESITFTVESSADHMERQHKTHNKGADARNAAYLKKYQELQVKFGETGVTVDIAKQFFTMLMSKDKSPSGVHPDLNDMFKTLRINDILRKTTGVTREDWTSIISAIKVEKRFITHTHHAFQAMDQDGSGIVTLDEAAELMVSHGNDGINLEDATKKVKEHAKKYDTDGDNTLSFPEFFQMILADREDQRNKRANMMTNYKKKKKNNNEEGTRGEKKMAKKSSSVEGTVATKKSKVSKKKGILKQSFRQVQVGQSVWGTPSRNVLEREEREKKRREAERLEKERPRKEQAEKEKRHEEEKAKQYAAYDKIAENQMKRWERMEEEKLARLQERKRRLQQKNNPTAPSTPSPESNLGSSLFRKQRKLKRMSPFDLSSMMLSCSVEVFGNSATDPKMQIIPASISIAGFPDKIPENERTDPEFESWRRGGWKN